MVNVWNVHSNLVREINVHMPSISSLGFLRNSDGGNSIVTGSSSAGVIQIYDMASGELIISFRHRGLKVTTVCEENRILVTGGSDGTIIIRDHHTGTIINAGGLTDVYALAVIPGENSRIISGGSDKMMNVWNTRTGEHLSCIETLSPIYTITAKHSILAAGGRDRVVYVWETSSFTMKGGLVGHEGVILSLVISEVPNSTSISPTTVNTKILDNDQLDLTSSTSGPVQDCSGGIIAESLSQEDPSTTATKLQVEGETAAIVVTTNTNPTKNKSVLVISASADKTIRVWDYLNGAMLYVFLGHSGAVTSLTVTHQPRTSWLISGSFDGKVLLWDLNHLASEGELDMRDE